MPASSPGGMSSSPLARNETDRTRRISSRMLVAIFVSVLVLAFGGYAWYQKLAETAKMGAANHSAPPFPKIPTETTTTEPKNILSFRDWEGSWDLQWEFNGQWYGKIMKLTSDRLGIAGDYILGTLKGSFINGDVSKATGEIKNVTGTGTNCRSGEQTGLFALTLSNDGRSMDGWWDVCGEGKKYRWKAVKRQF